MAGKPRPLTDRQQQYLDRFEGVWKAYRKVRAEAYERAKMQADAEIALAKLKAAEAARDARAAGVPMRRIGVGVMRTTDYNTVRQLIETADPVALAMEEHEPGARNIVLSRVEGSDQIRVVLSGDELDSAKLRADWNGIVPSQFTEAVFTRHESGKFIADTDGWVQEHQSEHPVVAWASLPSSQEKLRALYEEMV